MQDEVATVDQVLDSMQVWLELDDQGLACLIYRYEDTFDSLMGRLRSVLRQSNLNFAELKLPVGKPVTEVIAWLKDSFNSHPNTILFLSGWETAFPPGLSRADAIRQINFQREALTLHPVQQIWLFTEQFELDFLSSAPDFYSWFETKWRLLENPTFKPSSRPMDQSTLEELTGVRPLSSARQENAQKRVETLKERILEAKRRKLPQSTQLEVFLSAVKILEDASMLYQAKRILGDAMPSIKTLLKNKNDLTANSLFYLGGIEFSMLNYPEAISRYEEARFQYKSLRSVLGEANCIQSLGDIALRRSDHETARARYEEARPMYRQVGDVLGEANCIQSLGDIALRRSDHETARARYEEARPMYRQVGSVQGEANCIQSLGDIALRRSDHETARARYEEARPMYRQVGDVLGEANCIRTSWRYRASSLRPRDGESEIRRGATHVPTGGRCSGGSQLHPTSWRYRASNAPTTRRRERDTKRRDPCTDRWEAFKGKPTASKV